MVIYIRTLYFGVFLILLFNVWPFIKPIQAQEIGSDTSAEIPVQSNPLIQEIEGIPVFIYLNKTEQQEDRQIISTAQIVALTSIRLYKKVISPYLGAQCNFSPTCSEFGFQAIQKFGFLKATVMTADRLSRDHGFIRFEDYPQDESGHFINTVEDSYIFKNDK